MKKLNKVSFIIFQNLLNELSTQVDDDWWTKTERILRISIPQYLKNLLTLTGYDNVLSLKSFKPEDIDELETFGRTEMELFCDSNKPQSDYYGIYSKNKDNFKILPGHKRLLFGLVEYCGKLFEKNEASGLQEISREEKAATRKNSQITMRPVEVPANIDEMRKKILLQLKEYYEEFFDLNKITLKGEVATRFSDIQINVKLEESGGNSNSMYVANVQCIFCGIMVKGQKIDNRWVLSNYYKHLKNQHSTASAPQSSQSPSRKRKLEKLQSFVHKSTESPSSTTDSDATAENQHSRKDLDNSQPKRRKDFSASNSPTKDLNDVGGSDEEKLNFH